MRAARRWTTCKDCEAATGSLGHAPAWRDSLRHFLAFADTILDKTAGGERPLSRKPCASHGRRGWPGAQLAAQGRGRRDRHRPHRLPGAVPRAALSGIAASASTCWCTRAHAERFNRILQQLRPATARCVSIQVTEITPATAMLLADKVARGEFVAIAGDRVPVRPDACPCRPLPGPRGALAGRALRAGRAAQAARCFAMACVREGGGQRLRARVAPPRRAGGAAAPRPRRGAGRPGAALRAAGWKRCWRARRWTGSISPLLGAGQPAAHRTPTRTTLTAEHRDLIFDGAPPGRRRRRRAVERARRGGAVPTTRRFARASRAARDFLDRLLREDGVVYGVTTGYGDSCTVSIPPDLVAELPHHLYTFHGCGAGPLPRRPRRPAPCWPRAWPRCAQGMSGVSVAAAGSSLAQLLRARRAAADPGRRLGGRQRRPDAAVVRGRRAVRRARGAVRRPRQPCRRGAGRNRHRRRCACGRRKAWRS